MDDGDCVGDTGTMCSGTGGTIGDDGAVGGAVVLMLVLSGVSDTDAGIGLAFDNDEDGEVGLAVPIVNGAAVVANAINNAVVVSADDSVLGGEIGAICSFAGDAAGPIAVANEPGEMDMAVDETAPIGVIGDAGVIEVVVGDGGVVIVDIGAIDVNFGDAGAVVVVGDIGAIDVIVGNAGVIVIIIVLFADGDNAVGWLAFGGISLIGDNEGAVDDAFVIFDNDCPGAMDDFLVTYCSAGGRRIFWRESGPTVVLAAETDGSGDVGQGPMMAPWATKRSICEAGTAMEWLDSGMQTPTNCEDAVVGGDVVGHGPRANPSGTSPTTICVVSAATLHICRGGGVVGSASIVMVIGRESATATISKATVAAVAAMSTNE